MLTALRLSFSRALFLPTLIALLLAAPGSAPAEAQDAQIQAHPTLNEDGIHVQSWIKYPKVLDIPAAAQQAADAGKALMVIYEQPGCSYCLRMHTENFANPVLVNFMVKNFDIYQLDMTSEKPVVSPDGESMTQIDMASRYRVTGTPTTLFLDGDAEEMFRLPGYLQTPHHYAALRYYVADVNSGALSIPGFQAWINTNAEQVMNEFGS